MSDATIFFMFLIGLFALGVCAGVILSFGLIRWAIRDPIKEQLRQEREEINER